MPRLLNGTLAITLLFFFTATALQYVQAKDEENANSQLRRATETVHNISSAASDKAVPQKVLDGAKCVAVIPKLIKGTFVVGGEHGAGVATCKTSYQRLERSRFILRLRNQLGTANRGQEHRPGHVHHER